MIEGESEPATVKGRATRDRIISCAAELILREGLSGLSIANVRKAAGVSGSQITHYFADKESLVRAVIFRQTQAILDFHRQPALRNLDTLEDFERWAELTLRSRRRSSQTLAMPSYGALSAEIDNFDEETCKALAEGQRRWATLLETGLQRMKDHGRLNANADPHELALVLLSAHQGGNLPATPRRTWPDRRALDFALSYLRMFCTDG
jgi:AcrR family transcriptional regulator